MASAPRVCLASKFERDGVCGSSTFLGFCGKNTARGLSWYIGHRWLYTLHTRGDSIKRNGGLQEATGRIDVLTVIFLLLCTVLVDTLRLSDRHRF